MNRLKYSAVIILLLLPCVACGQTSRRYPKPTNANTSSSPQIDTGKLKLQAEEINQAFLRNDFGRVADLTYPKLVEILGGRARMIAFLEQGVKSMEAEGFKIVSVSIGEPNDVISDGHQLFAIVPTITNIKFSEGILVGQAFRIANSKDGGKNWTFVDGAGFSSDKGKLKMLFPTVADKLRLPEIKPPVLQREP